jgi:hypothetical protein
MDILKYLYQLGIVFIVLSIIWGFFMLLLRMITMGERKGIFEEHLLKSVNHFLIATLAASYALNKTIEDGLAGNGYIVATLIMLYLYMVGKLERRQMLMQMQQGFGGQMKSLVKPVNKKVGMVYLALTLVFYSVCVFYPQIVQNGFTQWFYITIQDFYDTPIIKWILMIVGFFFLLNILFRGVMQTQKLINGIANPHQNNNDHFDDNNGNDDFVDFEVVDDDEDSESDNNSLN